MNKAFLIIPVLILVAASFWFLKPVNKPAVQVHQNQEDNLPKVILTTPKNLDGSIILTTQDITLGFNYPIENKDELYLRFDPDIKYDKQLSSDRKQVKIIPAKPFELGTSYTLFILANTKFTGGGRLVNDKVYHFRTIEYRGV